MKRNFLKFFNNQKILTFIGVFIISAILWNRLLRERLPRDIPFILADFRFLVLLLLCLLLGFILIKIIANYFNYFNKNVSLLSKINDYILLSLTQTNFTFKEYFVRYLSIDFRVIYTKLLNFLYKQLSNSRHIYLLFMLSKIILPFILLFEIFYLKHIKIFYSLSFLFLLPLLYRFIYYNLYRYYLQQLEEISEVLNVVVGSLENEKEPLELLDNTGYHFFLQEITMDHLNVRKLTYSFHFSFKPSFVQSNLSYALPEELSAICDNLCRDFYSPMHKFYEILFTYEMHKKKEGLFIDIFALTIYFCCWSYILLTAHLVISFKFLYFLHNFQDYIEPFAQTTLL